MNRTRILLADDHVMFLEALKKLVEMSCVVVGTATDGRSLIASAEQLRPEVIVVDINMPHLNGLEACERLVKRLPQTKVIFLTVDEHRESAAEAVRRGASGYVLKKAAASELFKAIQTVMTGRSYITPLVSRDAPGVFVSRAKQKAPQQPLTLRQREVLQLLAEGKSMKEAANILNVTPRTIAFHKYSMMQHLGMTRNSELVRYAAHRGLCRDEVQYVYSRAGQEAA